MSPSHPSQSRKKEGGGEPDPKYPYIGFWPDVPKEKSGNWSKQIRRTPPDGEGELIRISVRKHHPFVPKSDFCLFHISAQTYPGGIRGNWSEKSDVLLQKRRGDLTGSF